MPPFAGRLREPRGLVPDRRPLHPLARGFAQAVTEPVGLSSGKDAVGETLGRIMATKDELTLTFGTKILTLGYGRRGRQKLDPHPLADCADRYFALSNGGSYRLKPDWSGPGQGSPPAMIIPPAAGLARLRGAVVTAGVVTTAEGLTVSESLDGIERGGLFQRDAANTYYQCRPRFRVRRAIGGAPAVLLKHPADGDYSRWLTDGLARLSLVENLFDLQHLVFIISAGSAPMRAVYEDSMALFGIRAEQIIEAGGETLVVDDLIYPAPLTKIPLALAPRCVTVLEQLATRVRANPFGHQRLFLRAATDQPGDAAMTAVALRHGFAVVRPEALSLYQRIGLFRQARIVVGTHGPALADAMFSTHDLTLVALDPPTPDTDMIRHLMSIKKGRYATLARDAPDDRHVTGAARFDRLLSQVLGRAPRE